MPRRLILTEEFIAKARALKEQGLTRRHIALNMHCSYSTIQKIFGPERLGIDRSNKQPWTIENLQQFKDCYKTMPIRELCLKFNRDRAELRQLLYHLGWDIPDYFFQKNKLITINKIKELSTKYNQLEISKILGMAQSSVQAICFSNNIKCVKSKCNLKTEEITEVKEEPKVIEEPKKTPQQLMAEAYKEQADAIRDKLREKMQ